MAHATQPTIKAASPRNRTDHRMTRLIPREGAGRDECEKVAPPREVGALERANHRVGFLIERVNATTGNIRGNADRVFSSRPESDDGGAEGVSASGEANILHHLLDVLEGRVSELEYEARRFADL